MLIQLHFQVNSDELSVPGIFFFFLSRNWKIPSDLYGGKVCTQCWTSETFGDRWSHFPFDVCLKIWKAETLICSPIRDHYKEMTDDIFWSGSLLGYLFYFHPCPMYFLQSVCYLILAKWNWLLALNFRAKSPHRTGWLSEVRTDIYLANGKCVQKIWTLIQ